jgi:hypothetical protein
MAWALVKATPMTCDDANVTGLHDVLLAKTAASFRVQFTAEKSAAACKDFRARHMNIGGIVEGMEISADPEKQTMMECRCRVARSPLNPGRCPSR